MSHSTDIEQRLRGENPEHCVVTDRLRANIGMPDTFQFDRDDAVELDELVLEAADEIARLEADNASLRSKLEEAEGARGWQPIETAPKDGTRVWLKNGQMRQPVIGQIDDYLSEFSGTVSRQWIVTHDPYDRFMPLQYGSLCVPTHWMPLASLREADHA